MIETLGDMFIVAWNLKWWILALVVVALVIAPVLGLIEAGMEQHHIVKWWRDPEAPPTAGWKCSCGTEGESLSAAQGHMNEVLFAKYGPKP